MENMFIELKSRFDFEQTVERLSASILDGGWKMPATHDLKATLAKSDLDVLPVKVLELCNPALAFQILGSDDARLFSNMLPCRISVYNKQDGGTYISVMNFPVLANQIGGLAGKVMIEAFSETMVIVNRFADFNQ